MVNMVPFLDHLVPTALILYLKIYHRFAETCFLNTGLYRAAKELPAYGLGAGDQNRTIGCNQINLVNPLNALASDNHANITSGNNTS